jgi:hypothetical protein
VENLSEGCLIKPTGLSITRVLVLLALPDTLWPIVYQKRPAGRPARVTPRQAREAGSGGRKRCQKQEFRGLIGLEDRRQAGMVLLYSARRF